MVRLKDALKTLNIDCNTTGEVRIGGDNDYLKIKSNGQLRLIGDAAEWLDIIGRNILGTGSLAPSIAIVTDTLKKPAFANTGTDEEFWNFELEHNTMLNTLVDLHLHCDFPTFSATGTYIEMTAEIWKYVSGVRTKLSKLTANIEMVPATHSGKSVIMAFSTTIDLTGMAVGDFFDVRLTRNNSIANNFSGNLFSTQMGMHRKVDSFGSDERLSKD